MKSKEKNLLFKKHKIENDSSLKKDEKIEIEEDLKSIYSEDGNLLDFKTISIKKKKSLWLKFLYFLVFISLLSAAVYFLLNYIKSGQDNSSVLEIKIEAPNNVAIGEDFFYEISYKNNSNYNLDKVEIEFNYPDNFIFLEAYSIISTDDNRTWRIENIPPKIEGTMKIRGKIINKEGFNNMLSVKSSYSIRGISSRFSRESFSTVSISNFSFFIKDDYFSTILVGEKYPLKIDIKDFPINTFNEIYLSFSNSENIFLEDDNKADFIEKISENLFKLSFENAGDYTLNFKYRAEDKDSNPDFIVYSLKYFNNDKELTFFEKELTVDTIKSDLHLDLSVNGSLDGLPLNFADQLNYSIKYSNRGDKVMKDLVIMAVIDSDFIDWKSFKDDNGGKISRKTVSWTFKEIPTLKELSPGESGEITFSLRVANFNRIEFGQNLDVKSYAQFSIANMEEFDDSSNRISDNRSNIVINKINSNLSMKEEVLYFNHDNIPVGSGPLPPVVGEKSSFRYYWTLKNSLHELRDIKIELPFPSYIIWENDFNISAGNINFDPLENKVFFSLSRWPLGIESVEVDFLVSIIPTNNEYNKIVVLSSGSSLEALDTETNDLVKLSTEVKTTKLEDDSIAAFDNDGRVR